MIEGRRVMLCERVCERQRQRVRERDEAKTLGSKCYFVVGWERNLCHGSMFVEHILPFTQLNS